MKGGQGRYNLPLLDMDYVDKLCQVTIRDSSGNVLNDLGPYVFRIYAMNTETQNSSLNLDPAKTYLTETLHVDPDSVTGVFYHNSEPNLSPTYVLLKTLYDNSVYINTTGYSTTNTYLRYTFTNDTYIQGSFSVNGMSAPRLYDSDGTSIITTPYTNANDGLYLLGVSSIDEEGVIEVGGTLCSFATRISNNKYWVIVNRITASQSAERHIAFFNDIDNYNPTPPGPSGEDPYSQGGTTGDDDTEPTGGTGDYDNDSDDIPVPLPPTNTAVDSGFITLYNPTLAQIQALGAFMWSDLFDLDTFKKLFGDPMQAILGLSLVPVIPPQGSSVEVRIGNVNTGVYMRQISNQFTQHDFGTIHLNEYWGGYLDYSPYTQVEIYLPFIGVRPLSADDVMNKDVHLIYNIDLLSGACIAFILVNENVLYQFIGQCSCSVPITGNDWTNVINGVLGIAGAIGTTVATGGMTTPKAISMVPALASSVVSSKPRVEKSGSLSGMGGMLGVFSPYLIITRPNQALPAGQNKFQGYPSFITRTLGTLSGFTRVSDVHLEGFTCTDAEKTEIKQLLEQGVIF